MKSWKTTAAGVAAIVAAIAAAARALLDGNPETAINWEATAAAVMAGVGLITARDNDRTSEEVGAAEE